MPRESVHLIKNSAIELRGVSKSYGNRFSKTEILKNVNMNVCKGSIYALLGPSGCGKTTLLKCVTGSHKPDKGKVLIFGQQPGSKSLKIPGSDVGYMPQELALYDHLKICEILRYFGKIYNMSKHHISSRTTFLIDLLNLPDENRLIKNLSGGQRRRVSFAIALLFEPPLLILDEPTVGVDPLLRQKIWNYLLELIGSGNITVVITTLYIEEAKQASQIGFMRKGRILVEDSPESIQANAETLEDAFLNICNIDDTSFPEDVEFSSSEKTVDPEEPTSRRKFHLKFLPENFFYCMSFTNILAVIFKNWKLSTRSYGMIALQVILPACQIALQFLTYGRPLHDLKLAVVNHDMLFGHIFLNFVDNNTIHKVIVPDLESGINLVLDGNAVGVMEIPNKIAVSIIGKIMNPALVSVNLLDSAKIKLHLDMTDLQIVNALQMTLLKAYEDFSKFTLHQDRLHKELASLPILYSKPIYGSFNMKFSEYAVPSVMLLFTFMVAVILTSLSSLSEKKSGLLDRNVVAGVSQFESMIGHAVIQLGIVLLQVGLNLLVTIVIFETICEGNIGLVILLSILVGASGIFYGYVISVLCNSELTSISLTVGSLIPIMFISGIMWPTAAMPDELQTFSVLVPLTMPNEAIRNIYSRGLGITHSGVWPGFLSGVAWIFIFICLFLLTTKVKR